MGGKIDSIKARPWHNQRAQVENFTLGTAFVDLGHLQDLDC